MTALELLTEAAAIPNCNELFDRVPPASAAERRARVIKDRSDRVSWGDRRAEAEE